MTSPRVAHADGFSMVVVMIVMLVSGLFVAGAFAAVDGDMPFARDGQDRKAAYAAAEAGLNTYLFQLARNTEYWQQCDQPTLGINNGWTGTGADPRSFRPLPGSPARYAIEILPAPGRTGCLDNDEDSVIDPSTGALRIRVTGEPRAGSPIRRTITATLRQAGFLDYLYFTTYEVVDPAAYEDPAAGMANCANRYRSSRPAGKCVELMFFDGDRVNGPFHTEDDTILTCGKPGFGRNSGDAIEVGGSNPKIYREQCGAGVPDFKSQPQANKRGLTMPSTNAELAAVVQPDSLFTGTTTIRLQDTSMTVTNGGVTTTKPLPANGVVFVRNGTGCSNLTAPPRAEYTETAGCAQLYVSGNTAKSLTLASENDVIVNGNLTRSNGAIVGLIATNYVRVYHPVVRTTAAGSVNGCRNATGTLANVTIQAAILSLQHSFTVDNYGCGEALQTLTVTGAIAQKYRGPVGSLQDGARTGYLKAYNYDDRLRYRSPPYFLEPVSSAWKVTRRNEQVPACGGRGTATEDSCRFVPRP